MNKHELKYIYKVALNINSLVANALTNMTSFIFHWI